MEVGDYARAGAIAARVREDVRSREWAGRTALEVCEYAESEIRRLGARCAFPVNVSINEVAAHYTAEPGDELAIGGSDTVKIDLGAQINGHIADTAVTVNYDPAYDGMVAAAEEALEAAMSAARAGARAGDLGRAIETTVRDRGYRPISNLSGHSLDTYTIHAGRSIPNLRPQWPAKTFSLSASDAYACEPFVTTQDGAGIVREGKAKNIYAIIGRRNTKDAEADRMLSYIWDSFNMLPFALRWLVGEWEEAEARRLLGVLVSKKAVKAYPVLVEVAGERVAQAEHTFIPGEDGPTVTTAASAAGAAAAG